MLEKQYADKGNIVPVIWGEHCLECSAPQCYSTCPRFAARKDGHCRRFEAGIEPVIYADMVAARVSFKSWAKMEAEFIPLSVSARDYISIYKKSIGAGRLCTVMSTMMPGFFLKSKWTGVWNQYMSRLIGRCGSYPAEAFNLEGLIYNDGVETSVFVDFMKKDRTLLQRTKVILPTGDTRISIPIGKPDLTRLINVHPSGAEDSITLVFADWDVIPCIDRPPVMNEKKVKCVIWDLDDTIWKGVLVENDHLTLRSELADLIVSLDKKGIVSSVASKNDEQQAMARLQEFGLEEYFVFRKINWDPKSVNIQKTIRQMNINPDTVVFVDDNPFEREEVKRAIPSITCVSPEEIADYAAGPRFDVPVSPESQGRRKTYVMLEKFKKEEASWDGSIDDFLISCQIKVFLSHPSGTELPRCYELLQRTNQLNASGRRLSLAEVKEMVASPAFDCYVLRSGDRFGDYGIVGFMIVGKRTACITDFVISCRVANKRIEPSVINYLAGKYGGEILFNYKETGLNGPMRKVIDDLNMTLVQADGGNNTYRHGFVEYPGIVEISDCTG
ncbi:MAG: HAD-IIIC family phosphatase [Bacteroidales bacterium]|nr:HAD-IIIC family phosphatase [Bacteroidales bacterium]